MLINAGFYQFRPEFGQKERNLSVVMDRLEQAEADLLVLPELFATGYQFISGNEVVDLAEDVPGGRTTRTLQDLARSRRVYIIGGLAERDGGDIYNSAVFVGPEGFIGCYRKTHLFYEEKLFFKPGNTGFQVWETKIGKIGVMICFDWFFPESMRTLALMGAEVVAHPANLVLPYCPKGMPTRCLENMVFGITANRTGIESRKQGESLRFIGNSQVLSPRGEVLLRGPDDKEFLGITEIDPGLAREKKLNEYNQIFRDRREEYYR